MRVVQLDIRNFRNIKEASLSFGGHTLFLGLNNVGKSTVCEALDLVLGPDRLTRFPPVEEFDFYNAKYSAEEGAEPINIDVQVSLIGLSDELLNKCAPHLSHWHLDEKRVLGIGEADLVDGERVCECLRLKAVASYNVEEDEFEARTVFMDGPAKSDGSPADVPKSVKRQFGFLYLRTLRTGSRALSLERGSLLDIILRQREARTGIWESSIQRLKSLDPPIDEGTANLGPILENIEKRVAQYIPLEGSGRATQLFVSKLTREHLRETISFFLKISADQEPVPFREVGTGTLNTLVLALLTFIAEMKKENVIFAMEEPEIALPPFTQRRIANYLLERTSQCIVTSHSPYVIERFMPDQIQVLRRDNSGKLNSTSVPGSSVLKGKTYRKHARRGLAEAMLGCGVIVGEGITEKDAILATAAKMEDYSPETYFPLDLSGVTVLSADGDGSIPEFGAFFQAMQIKSFAFCDAKVRKPEEQQKLASSFDICCQTAYVGTERLLVDEIPTFRLWQFLQDLRDSGEKPGLVLPDGVPQDDAIKALSCGVLEKDKGSGFAARLIEFCEFEELPATLVRFLSDIYALFPRPEPIPPIDGQEVVES